MNYNKTVTKDTLMQLGYTPYQAKKIISQAKKFLVQQGFLNYANQRLGIVPTWAVEEITGLRLVDQTWDKEKQVG